MNDARMAADLDLLPPSKIDAAVDLRSKAQAITAKTSSVASAQFVIQVFDPMGSEIRGIPVELRPLDKTARDTFVVVKSSTVVHVIPGRYSIVLQGILSSQVEGVLEPLELQRGELERSWVRLRAAQRQVRFHVMFLDSTVSKYAIVNAKVGGATQTIRSMRPQRVPMVLCVGSVEVTANVYGYSPCKVVTQVPEGSWDDVHEIKLVIQ
jgi:hypothetical protein